MFVKKKHLYENSVLLSLLVVYIFYDLSGNISYILPRRVMKIVAIIISALVVSFSTAGVPGAGIIMMSTVLTAADLPLAGIALVAGVDRLTDGFRTLLNVVGNTANAVMLDKWEAKNAIDPNQKTSQ